MFQQTVGERTLPVVDVRDDAEIANMFAVHVGHYQEKGISSRYDLTFQKVSVPLGPKLKTKSDRRGLSQS